MTYTYWCRCVKCRAPYETSWTESLMRGSPPGHHAKLVQDTKESFADLKASGCPKCGSKKFTRLALTNSTHAPADDGTLQ